MPSISLLGGRRSAHADLLAAPLTWRNKVARLLVDAYLVFVGTFLAVSLFYPETRLVPLVFIATVLTLWLSCWTAMHYR